MASIQSIEIHGGHGGHDNNVIPTEFPKKEGIKYCQNCGYECLSDDKECQSCGRNSFLSRNISEIIGGYLNHINKNRINKLRIYYYRRYNTNSVVKMNNKRIIQYLLMKKHKIELNKEIIDKIWNKKF